MILLEGFLTIKKGVPGFTFFNFFCLCDRKYVDGVELDFALLLT